MVIPLCNTDPGEHARIVFLDNEDRMAARLMDLGFVPGARLTCVLQKKNRSMAAYLVRSAVIALRKEDSRFIMVSPVPEEDGGRPEEVRHEI